jgi:hypothetical protein
MKKLLALLALFAAPAMAATAPSTNPPSILNNTQHLAYVAQGTLAAEGIPFTTAAAPTSSLLAVNENCISGVTGGNGCITSTGSVNFLFFPTIIANAMNLSQFEFPLTGSTAIMPSVPYQVINQSSAGYGLGYDQAYYATLEADGIAYVMAFCGAASASDYPPIAFSTILTNNPNYGSAVGGNGCGYAQGIEFSLAAVASPGNPNGYTYTWTPCTAAPCVTGNPPDAGSASSSTEILSGTMAALRYNHRTWTWGDVKAALRQTASNWTTGYNYYNPSDINGNVAYGYGNINYVNANAIAATSAIYLQAPGMSVTSNADYAKIVLYPFMQTRRVAEALYSVPAGYAWPGPATSNEYTYAQIVASGATLIAESNGTDVTPTYIYFPSGTGTSTTNLVAFTVDNATLSAANFSRVESFSTVSVTLASNSTCLRQ